HETVVAFINEGNGRFHRETIFEGPHPAYGSSGIQLVDINGDGHTDVLYTNGDTLDRPSLLKPYHGIQWLENPGDGSFPWKHHWIAPMYGVHRAIAADVTGHGRMDIIATSFLPEHKFPDRRTKNLDGIILLQQTTPGKFERYVIKGGGLCDHVSCVYGDVMGTG